MDSLWTRALEERAVDAGLSKAEAREFRAWVILYRGDRGRPQPDELVADRAMSRLDRLIDEWKKQRGSSPIQVVPRKKRKYHRKKHRR